MTMNNTNKIIIAVVVVGIIGAAYYFYKPEQQINVGNGAATSTAQSPYEQQVSALAGAPLTKAQKEEALTASGPEKLKIFNVAIATDSINPNAIVVEKGDLVQLNVYSDRDVKLESKDLQFTSAIKGGEPYGVSIPVANVGTYTFYCQDGNSRTIFGHIVVMPRG